MSVISALSLSPASIHGLFQVVGVGDEITSDVQSVCHEGTEPCSRQVDGLLQTRLQLSNQPNSPSDRSPTASFFHSCYTTACIYPSIHPSTSIHYSVRTYAHAKGLKSRPKPHLTEKWKELLIGSPVSEAVSSRGQEKRGHCKGQFKSFWQQSGKCESCEAHFHSGGLHARKGQKNPTESQNIFRGKSICINLPFFCKKNRKCEVLYRFKRRKENTATAIQSVSGVLMNECRARRVQKLTKSLRLIPLWNVFDSFEDPEKWNMHVWICISLKPKRAAISNWFTVPYTALGDWALACVSPWLIGIQNENRTD